MIEVATMVTVGLLMGFIGFVLGTIYAHRQNRRRRSLSIYEQMQLSRRWKKVL